MRSLQIEIAETHRDHVINSKHEHEAMLGGRHAYSLMNSATRRSVQQATITSDRH